MEFPVRFSEQLTPILRGVRKKKKLSQDAVGATIGLKQEAISTLELTPGVASVDRFLLVLSALGLELIVREIPKTDTTPKGEW